VVADAGMLSEANLKDLEDAELRFIVGARIPEVPYQVAQWRREHPGEPIGDGQIFVQPTIMGTKETRGGGRSSTSTAPTGRSGP
jgi:hypothetical protein